MALPSNGQIVVIDDNQDLADLFGSLCGALGYQVYVGYSGLNGLNLIRTYTPQVVFCDINMPGMDGLEVARTIRREFNQGRPLLIAITAWGDADSTRQTLGAGFDAHLTKPADFSVISHMLKAYYENIS